MTFTSTLTSLATLFCLCMFHVNAATNKEFLQLGKSLGTSDTILSYGGNFELGFFSRENSTKYYVGIWYKRVPNDKIVWVANRDYPVETSSAVLKIQSDGNIVITDGKLTYRVNKASNNFSTYAILLDSGNLLLVNSSNQAILWQSFDDPTDTIIPGMNLGYNSDNSYSLRSWTSADDPAPGAFSLEYFYGGGNLIVYNGTNVFWIDSVFQNETGFEVSGGGILSWSLDGNDSRLILEVSGELIKEHWSDEAKSWVPIQSSKCGTNNSCGAFSICNPSALYNYNPCDCLRGFKPLHADSWRKGNISGGCVRKTDLSCSDRTSNTVESNDGFLQLYKVQLPKNLNGYTKLKIGATRECETTCSRNCSCVAYAYYLNSGTCQLWHGRELSLKNISSYVYTSDDANPIFYLRVAASELETSDSNTTNAEPRNDSGKHVNWMILLIVILISLIMFLILGIFVYWTRRQRRKGEDLLHFDVSMSMKVEDSELEAHMGARVTKKEVKLPLFSFESVAAATNNFSHANKLGEGGFGPVYKGILLNGGVVAVKRLSRRSAQGWEELKNEALLIAKLQHNNLVRLLGCCIDRDEKMLIYEYMANKSLDVFLFDATKRSVLDWGSRVRIIW